MTRRKARKKVFFIVADASSVMVSPLGCLEHLNRICRVVTLECPRRWHNQIFTISEEPGNVAAMGVLRSMIDSVKFLAVNVVLLSNVLRSPSQSRIAWPQHLDVDPSSLLRPQPRSLLAHAYPPQRHEISVFSGVVRWPNTCATHDWVFFIARSVSTSPFSQAYNRFNLVILRLSWS